MLGCALDGELHFERPMKSNINAYPTIIDIYSIAINAFLINNEKYLSCFVESYLP